jgi:uncharacterized SAM-binding protein YcdF (DUF218 family)
VFFFLSKLLDVLLSPYSWGLLLLVVAIPWRARGARQPRAARHQRRRRVYGIAGLVLLCIASSNLVSNALLWHVEHQTTSTYREDVTYDAVVLLGGIVDEEASAASGQASYNENVERLVVTHRLLRDGKARVAILSGAAMYPSLAAWGEAVMLARQLEDWGIAKDRIIIEDRARNTRENAVFSQAIARERGFGRVLIVTSAFHMPRAEECFAAVGMKVDTLSVDYRGHEHWTGGALALLPRAGSLAITSAITREILGRAIYRLQGYGKAVPPS